MRIICRCKYTIQKGLNYSELFQVHIQILISYISLCYNYISVLL